MNAETSTCGQRNAPLHLSRRDLQRGILAVVATGIMPRLAVAAAGPAINLSHVHPELRPFVEGMVKATESFSQLSVATLPSARAAMEDWIKPPLASPPWQKRDIPGPTGAPPVPVYIINSEAGRNRPAILHTHGGGFVAGKARDGIAYLQKIAAELDCTIVTVDYRLAPETTYAGSVADNYAALVWLHGHAHDLGIDASRIAVMGESAGGGHAALLALKARDEGVVPLVAQILAAPMLDDRTGTVTTPAAPIGELVWTAAGNRFGWASFLGQQPGTSTVPSAAVPARRNDLRGLPPAFIGVGSLDLFVDEDIAYARALIDAGVMAELVVVPGAFHGFEGLGAGTKVARDFNTMKANALRRAFGIA